MNTGDAEAAGDGMTASEGSPCGGTGGDNWVGGLGAAGGTTSGFGVGNCAQSAPRKPGQLMTSIDTSSTASAATTFNLRIFFWR